MNGFWISVTDEDGKEMGKVPSSETCEIMHNLAMRWRSLADEDEATRKPPGSSQAPSRAQPWPSSDGQGTREDRR